MVTGDSSIAPTPPLHHRLAGLWGAPRSAIGIACSLILVGVVAAVSLVRFIGLAESPPGFYVDEAASAVTLTCLATEKTDGVGHRFPLFGDAGFGTPKPPTYLYPGVLWLRVFGNSIGAVRGFTAAIVTVHGMVLVLLARRLGGGRLAAFVGLTATLSPWAFLSSRIAWEVPVAALLVSLGQWLYLTARGAWLGALAGVSLALGMISYPPALVQVPIAFGLLVWFGRVRFGVSRRVVVAALLAFLVTAVPLVALRLGDDRFAERLAAVGVVSIDGSAVAAVQAVVGGLGAYLDPAFLFGTGDRNPRHSTQFSGQLGWVDVLALVVGVAALIERGGGRSGGFGIPVFLALNLLAGVLPGALATDGAPHALRAIGGWPFVALLGGFALRHGIERRPAWLPVLTLVAALFAGLFVRHFFATYPLAVYGAFDGKIREFGETIRTRGSWRYALSHYPERAIQVRYFMLRGLDGETCTTTRERTERFLSAR